MTDENAKQLRRRIVAPRHTYDKAIARSTGVTINRKHFWTAPILVGDNPSPRSADDLIEAQALLVTFIANSQAALAAYPDQSDLTTTRVTRIITDEIQNTLYRLKAGNTYRELSLPYRPGEAEYPGRVDLALLRPGKPDILIEIDHAPKPTSADKLKFIADQGGLGLWIRWDDWNASIVC